jgi:hypothetical protein
MAQDGTAPSQSRDSLGDAVDAASEAANRQTQDTPVVAEPHAGTPAEPDIDKLLADLEANRDKIPPEKLAALNPQMQVGFNRKMNRLQQSVDTVTQAAAKAGIELPPDKTVMDLLTEDNGKGFIDLMSQIQQKSVAPMAEFVNNQKTQAKVLEMANVARSSSPLVAEHYDAIIREISGNENLATLGASLDWEALPLVMEGVAYKRGYEKAVAENKRLTTLLEKNKIATKVGSSSTLAGAPPAKDTAPAKGLDAKIEAAYQRLKQGAA